MSRISRFLRLLALVAAAALSACAGDVAKPDVVLQDIGPQRGAIQVSDVTSEAADGVQMRPDELQRVTARVKAELARQAAAASPQNAHMKILFTKYDRGSAFARFLIAGAGQIVIEAEVSFLDDAGGQQIGKYKVSKDFSFGGIYGGSTSVEDVEGGFAKSVAALLQSKG
jgi:hypothetical protein